MRDLQATTVREASVADGGAMTDGAHRRGLIVATLAALLMAFVGAFDTAGVPLLPRLAFWLIVMESGALIGIGASSGIRGWGRLADRPVLEGALISILIALPLTLVTSGATALFFGARSVGLREAAVLFVAVFVITAAITAINYALGRTGASATVAGQAEMESVRQVPVVADTGERASRPRLSSRLPPHRRHAAILALAAEDHYVRVHTTDGSDLILLRLTDAMAELDGMEGARTHRSWWVARAAVSAAVKGEGRGELVLTNGVTAPVSRSALAQLQRDGWFTD